jgi:hypothetical protein
LLAELHVPYVSLTIGQNSGFYLSPNATYDSFVGFPESKCSRRDLIADMYQALEPYGIRMMAYIPSGAPEGDLVARERLEAPDDPRHAPFQRRWEAVLREWSLRWGRNVHAWWVDGLYKADNYRHTDPPNLRSLTEALKAGNPDVLVTYNNGLRTPVYSIHEYDDFTPGEVERDLPVSLEPDWSCPHHRLRTYSRWINGAQFHILTPMGLWWGTPPVRFPGELIVGYTKCINSQDGTVTWDVPLTSGGLIEPEFLGPLSRLGREIPPRSNGPDD